MAWRRTQRLDLPPPGRARRVLMLCGRAAARAGGADATPRRLWKFHCTALLRLASLSFIHSASTRTWKKEAAAAGTGISAKCWATFQ